MEIVKKTIIHVVCLVALVACNGEPSSTSPSRVPVESTGLTVSNAVMDSIGELAYSTFEAYQKDPQAFLAPIEGKELTDAQQETYLWILINMAYGFQEHNDILQSTAYYEKALLYNRDHAILGPSDRLNYLYKPLANNYTILSDYGKGERLQLQALEEAADDQTKASFYNNLALLYSYKGEEDKAVEFGLQGLAYCADNSLLCVMLHNTLSNSYGLIGQMDSARWHNRQSLLKIPLIAPQSEAIAGATIVAYGQQAKFLQQDGRYQDAERSLVKAHNLENTVFPNTRFREKARLLNQLGLLKLADDQASQAKAHFQAGLSLYEKESERAQSSTYTKVDLLKNLAWSYKDTEPDSTWKYFQQAVEADFVYQQGVTSKASHLRNNYWNRELLEFVFQFAHSTNLEEHHLISLYWMTELTKGRLLWNDINRSAFWAEDARVEEVSAQLRTLYTEKDRSRNTERTNQLSHQIDSLLALFELEENYFNLQIPLPRQAAFLERLKQEKAVSYSYFIHADQSISVFKNDRGELAYWHRKAPGIIDTLSTFKERYFTTTPHHFNADPAAYFESAAYLREQLLPALPWDETGNRDLKLSLDNELFTLPFDALTVERDFIASRYNVQYIHSELISQLHTKREFTTQPIHILYKEAYEAPMPDLTYVAEEVKSLDKFYKTQLFPPDNISTNILKQAFNHPGIIHIAAHAILDTANEASLLLDNPISTDQLRYYNMSSPLVVLSACNTASGELLLSEGLESMNRTFLSKGVKGVIANHWFANDNAMLDLTQKFYAKLSETQRPLIALANAKRHYLSEQPESGRNPWYWANMAYMGEDIKIDLPHRAGLFSHGLGKFVWPALLIIGLAGLLAYRRFT